jgi:hypothetical protein
VRVVDVIGVRGVAVRGFRHTVDGSGGVRAGFVRPDPEWVLPCHSCR